MNANFNQLLEVLKDNAGVTGLLVAFVGLISALFGAAVSFAISSRNTYINTITVQRSEWIEKLRLNIALYISIIHSVRNHLIISDDFDDDDKIGLEKLSELMRELRRLEYTIILQLNPNNSIDKNIICLLEDFFLYTKITTKTINSQARLVSKHSQWLLKNEWEKVKYEAKPAYAKIFSFLYFRKRRNEYLEWANDEGEIAKHIMALNEHAESIADDNED